MNWVGSSSIPVDSRKKGYEQRHADELDVLHERAAGGDEAIEREPCEERAHDPFEAHPVGDERGRGQRCEEEEEAGRVLVAEARERPRAQPAQREHAIEDEEGEPDRELEEDHRGTVVAVLRAHHDRQHEQRERVGDHGSAGGHPHGAVPRESVLLDDRVRDERVRGPERAVQGRGCEPVAEREHEQEPEDERERERERSEAQRRAPIALELVQVELEPGEKHEVEQPERAERLDDPFTRDPVENERPDEGSPEDDPDEPRQAETVPR